MVSEQLPKKLINITAYECNIIILDVKRTILKISQHYQKHNEEFRTSRKKKVRENLKQYLLDDEIIKGFVKQLEQKEIWFERIDSNSPSLKHYGCKLSDQRNNLIYLMIFFLDDNNPEIIKVITVHPINEGVKD